MSVTLKRIFVNGNREQKTILTGHVVLEKLRRQVLGLCTTIQLASICSNDKTNLKITNWVTRCRKLKDRQHNYQNKKDKQ
jgi:hypothetical protein